MRGEGGRALTTLVAAVIGAGAAWWLVPVLAPAGDPRVGVAVGAVVAIASGFAAGNLGEALVIVLTLSVAFGLGLFTLGRADVELTLVRTIAVGLYAGVCSGQLLVSAYNELLASPPGG